MKKIAIFGFGGLGREVATIINKINSQNCIWDLIGFFDDSIEVGTSNKYGTVLGGMEDLNKWDSPLSIVIAIATPSVVRKIAENTTNPNISFPNIIAPTVLYFDEESVNMGIGNIICHNCRLSCSVSIGNFNALNGSVSLGHEAKVGNYNVFQPDVRISGESSIGDGNFFGVRSTVLQQITIGNNTRIGAGSMVMRKTKDNMTYIGNPARILKGM